MNLISEKDANKKQLLANITKKNYINKKIEKLEKEKKNLENCINNFSNLYKFITNIEEDKKELTKIKDKLTNNNTNVKNNLVNFLNEKLELAIFELGEDDKLNLKSIKSIPELSEFCKILKTDYDVGLIFKTLSLFEFKKIDEDLYIEIKNNFVPKYKDFNKIQDIDIYNLYEKKK